MSITKWFKERKTYIGGSDIGAIVGMNKYKTAVDVYLDKTSEDIKLINHLEYANVYAENEVTKMMIKKYVNLTRYRIKKPRGLIFHKDYSFLGANINRWVGDKEYILECKSADYLYTDYSSAIEWGEQGTDQIPNNYLCQVAWYSAITGVPKVDIAVLIGDVTEDGIIGLSIKDFRIYTYTKNKEFEDKLITIGKNFWLNHVQKGIPPEPSN